ncbi:MAG: M20 family metallopeptidase [Burkholderiaceae bacterium]|nr:M20 family metallopeptidase [Burkholderiaceae bacterium]
MNVVELTRKLVSFQSINPPGDESAAISFIGQWLQGIGFDVQVCSFGDRRANLVARFGPQQSPLCLSGHIDVVPLGTAQWQHDPFAGEEIDGRLYGRGSCDMKGGIAAFLVAIENLLRSHKALRNGILIIITGGEETGCTGARALTEQISPPAACLLVIPEPTSNEPVIAHKGVAWLKLVTKGKTAHGSMPDQGINAITKMAHALIALSDTPLPGAHHPVLGHATFNVGMIGGGLNTNSVADLCWANVDIRLTPNCSAQDIQKWIAQTAPDVIIEQVIAQCPSVYTDPHEPNVASVLKKLHDDRLIVHPQGKAIDVAPCAGHNHVEYDPAEDVTSAVYFTDASVLKSWLGDVPTLILGPGDGFMAHKTDEYVEVEKLERSVSIFERIVADRCL